MIELRHLNKTYENAEPLKDVSVTIHDGDAVAVIGPSGTGKSTLIRCINLLEKPTAGQIFLDGKEITALCAALLVPLFRFGEGAAAGGREQTGAVIGPLFSVIPSDPATPFAAGNMMQAIFMAVLSGCALLVLIGLTALVVRGRLRGDARRQ